MTKYLPPTVKLERKKHLLSQELERTFTGVNVSTHLYEIVYSCVKIAEIGLYKPKGKMGEHKKGVIMNFIMSKHSNVDREMLSKMIDSIASKVKEPGFFDRFVRWSSRFFQVVRE